MFLALKKYSSSAKIATKNKASWIFYLLVWLGSSEVIANSSTAFFYGKPVPAELLTHFQQVVVEPDNFDNVGQLKANGADVFAYISVGEINSSRTWFAEIPESWLLGKNRAWGSHIVDVSQKAWHEYLINKLMAPLWERGYRGFFLDTLDSYQLITQDIRDRHIQKQALIDLIREIHQRFPGVKIIINRGFELLPDVAGHIVAVAAESLFQGWNGATSSYGEIQETDSEWLQKKLKQVHDQFGLQIIVIDYVPPNRRDLAREVADKIKELGFTPWISNPTMDMMGIGSEEVVPKRILVLLDTRDPAGGLPISKGYQFLAKFIEYFGYTFEYIDAPKRLPNFCLVGQYTALVTFLKSDVWLQSKVYKSWLKRQSDDGMQVVALGKN